MGFFSVGTVLLVLVELTLVAGALALAFRVGRSSERVANTRALAIAFMLVALAASVTAHLASINFAMPVGWIAGLAVCAVALVALFVLLGMGVKWRVSKVIAILAIALLMVVAYFLPQSFGGGHYLQPLYEQRGAQIARANGFTAMLPPGERMKIDYGWFVEPVDGGLNVEYEGFSLRESKGTGATESELAKLVQPGSSPMGGDLPEERIQSGGTVTTLTVQGKPAMGVEYSYMAPEAAKGGGGKSDVTAILVFELDGTRVAMSSWAATIMPGGEVDAVAVGLADLVKIAETMRPIR